MSRYTTCVSLLSIVLIAISAFAQTDPGPRQGPPAAGRPLRALTPSERDQFQEGARRFNEVDSVSGTHPGAAGSALGARFNMNSGAGCLAFPSPGGLSPASNQEIDVATVYGAKNSVGSFIDPNGPVRVVRF